MVTLPAAEVYRDRLDNEKAIVNFTKVIELTDDSSLRSYAEEQLKSLTLRN